MRGAPLDASQERAFCEDLAETNRRRMRVVLPLMIVGHAIHVAVFYVPGSRRAALDPTDLAWRDGISIAHLVAIGLGLALLGGVYRLSSRWLFRVISPAAALNYLLHGAVCASIDQLAVTAVTPYIGYALAIAFVLYLTPRQALLVYALGIAAFVIGIHFTQHDPSARLAILPNGISISVVSVLLSCFLYFARRREFLQRHIIERQRAELSTLNAQLESRVSEQVGEIVARAAEVEALNAQLQARVRERSAELSVALARMSQRPDSHDRLAQGALLAERFEIGALLGQGGMGTVYAGTDRSNGAAVAIKVIRLESARGLDALQRFLREARLAATVSHPSIVRMLHVDVSDSGVLFHVQELVQGEVLSQRLRPGFRWDPGIAARLCAALSAALAEAHACGVIHRDIKPGNVMLVERSPGLKLLDFGIAKLFEDATLGASETRTGMLLGTPQYMAPEQLAGRDVSDRADVYALGVLLFQLLTGRFPREAHSLQAPIAAHKSGESGPIPSLREAAAQVPVELHDIVRSCLDGAASARPSASELYWLLSRWADREAVPALDLLERKGSLCDLDARAEQGHATLAEAR